MTMTTELPAEVLAALAPATEAVRAQARREVRGYWRERIREEAERRVSANGHRYGEGARLIVATLAGGSDARPPGLIIGEPEPVGEGDRDCECAECSQAGCDGGCSQCDDTDCSQCHPRGECDCDQCNHPEACVCTDCYDHPRNCACTGCYDHPDECRCAPCS